MITSLTSQQLVTRTGDSGHTGPFLTSGGRWLVAPKTLSLTPGEVHVWRIAVTDAERRLPQLEQLLIPEERARVARFRRDADRTCRIVARGMLRSLLAEYLGTTPRTVVLAYGQHGKPMLEPGSGEQAIEFSVAHSGDMVLLALTVGGPVGVDVEAAQGDIDLSGLSARVLAPDELAVLEQADEPLRSRLFNQAWTRKEAALKLLGTGFSLDPSRVVVLTDSLSASIPCVCQDLAGRPRRLRVLDLALGEKAAAAVAVERADANVCCFSGASREIPKPVRRTLAESGRV